jgi:hypothetical protein
VRLDRPAREAPVAELEALPVEAAYLFGSQDAGEATPPAVTWTWGCSPTRA